MKIVIDIPENLYKATVNGLDASQIWDLRLAVKNGTPLDEHDEEVIAETVESIWGKPPYRDMLDKIRDEVLKLDDPDYDFEGYYKAVTDALKIIDKYKTESEKV